MAYKRTLVHAALLRRSLQEMAAGSIAIVVGDSFWVGDLPERQGPAALALAGQDSPQVPNLPQMKCEMAGELAEKEAGGHSRAAEDVRIFLPQALVGEVGQDGVDDVRRLLQGGLEDGPWNVAGAEFEAAVPDVSRVPQDGADVVLEVPADVQDQRAHRIVDPGGG